MKLAYLHIIYIRILISEKSKCSASLLYSSSLASCKHILTEWIRGCTYIGRLPLKKTMESKEVKQIEIKWFALMFLSRIVSSILSLLKTEQSQVSKV